MSTVVEHDRSSTDLEIASVAGAERHVVAVVLECRGRLALLKRSAAVHHDQGRWHCVTGYLEPGHTPLQQAMEELFEETGLRLVDLVALAPGRVLTIPDGKDTRWHVHTFRAVTQQRRLIMNWEHDAYRWTTRRGVCRFDGQVAWLPQVIEAVDDSRAQRS